MGVIVAFDYTAWQARYPEFSASGTYPGVPQATVEACFTEATTFCRNDGFGPVNSAPAQLTYLNMLTAHIVQLNFGSRVSPLLPFPGQANNVHEGSVGLGITPLKGKPGSEWYYQTKYGAAFWEATAPYRTMRYLAGRRRVFDPFFLTPLAGR